MLISRIRLQNILSFGPDGMELEMVPLSVLIGPNGSGKSNLIDVLGLLKALPTDLEATVREREGPGDWMWQRMPVWATIVLGIKGPVMSAHRDLLYALTLIQGTLEKVQPTEKRPLVVLTEKLSVDGNEGTVLVERELGHLSLSGGKDENKTKIRTDEYQVGIRDSILTGLTDERHYPEVAYVGQSLKDIRLYREWIFGRNAPLRLPQKRDLTDKYLLEDASNLGLVLNRLAKDDNVKKRLVSHLRELYEGALDLRIGVEHDSVQVFVQEGDVSVPATRLSDGTLRYLCLLAILCDPHPPPVVCLEEPELGLHPDILPGLARLLREASERCQLVVTTHSDVIVDALTETPESIVVCEKHDGQTTMKRLRKSDLDQWLDRYQLGELWSSGELGGNRW